jgi:alpha-beta hydrolase superfamily lysophospholipase
MPIRSLITDSIKSILKAIAYGALGGAVVLVTVFVLYLENRPDLEIWHKADLDAEFTQDSEAKDFADYLAIEDKVFDQLVERVYSEVPADKRQPIIRYAAGGLTDPDQWSPNWNRTFEFAAPDPRAGVLLLHGFSDSPYSLRGLGERLHEAGMHVLGVRLPGHGTAPSGLTAVHWRDMAAATRLAADHVKATVGDRPLYFVGYSTGGALAVQYALEGLDDPNRHNPDGIVLISPAIGVTSLAVLAVWQARLGHLLGLDKLEWNAILPEYDPFKYGSFAVNAGDQVYRLTVEISKLLRLKGEGAALNRLPPILAFQSAVDATVSAPALVNGLMAHLPPGRGELVLFDINRATEVEPLLLHDPKSEFNAMLKGIALPFSLTVMTNDGDGSRRLVAWHKEAGKTTPSKSETGLVWPDELYSLAHVALPFASDDPLYGKSPSDSNAGIYLGNMALRGERGVLRIPASDMLRLRWNPFYDYLEKRVLDFMGVEATANTTQADPG